MKKGFTLIELLAVIVILSIILLISVPIITGLIEDVKEESLKDTSYGLIKAAELKYARNGLENKTNDIVYTFENGVDISTEKLEFDGKIPKEGIIYVTEGKVSISIYEEGKCFSKGLENSKVLSESTTKDACLEKVPLPIVYLYYDKNEGVNKPILKTGMIAVKHNGTNWVTVADPNNDTSWYDYSNKEWANVVLVTNATRNTYLSTSNGTVVNENDIVAYYVWIPRYGYQISTNYHTDSVGNINVKFLKDATDVASDKSTVATVPAYSGSSQTNYIKHPAFTFDTEIPGFWMAKFESSNDGSNNVNIKPNVTSWTNITIGNMFNYSLAMKTNTIKYGFVDTEVDTHMSKNSEWGAVAYLSQSNFGKNSQIWINNSSIMRTGCTGASESTTATIAGCTNTYSTVLGQNGSTTGNIYGVYDMSGGAGDYVMGYVNTAAAATNFPTIASLDVFYKDIYVTGGVGSRSACYAANTTVIGDAIYETSLIGDGDTNSWNLDVSYFGSTTTPWLIRGGYYGHGNSAGIFGFSSDTGVANSIWGFRTAIVTK